ncbi:MAG TPA: SPW repeat protein [Bryobacteraceae bacterium]|nr:SPW repeat protein [Bryobacteraceae bacterium]
MTDDRVSAIRTASTINFLAGLWLFVSPWVYRASSIPNAWNSWIVGIVIAILAAVGMENPFAARGASVFNMLLGIWTFASPWIFRYTGDTGRFINSLCVGAIVFILGAYGSSAGRTTTFEHTPPLRS